MSNDLATLNGYFDTQLREATVDTVWTSSEKDNLLTWAAAGLWPRIKRPLNAQDYTITLVDGTYFYAINAGIALLVRVDWVDTSDNERGALADGLWEVDGDLLAGTAKLHVAPAIAAQGGTLRLNGYGRYDLTTNYPRDRYVPLILAIARAEALRRLIGDRARFTEWLSREQNQNVTVNELILMVNEADNEAKRLMSEFRTWSKPVPGRI